MRQTYVIQWKSMANGRAGRGTKAFSRDEGERLVEELNREYPQIHHELIVAPPPRAEQPIEEESEQEAKAQPAISE
jgi:hypothetical protein